MKAEERNRNVLEKIAQENDEKDEKERMEREAEEKYGPMLRESQKAYEDAKKKMEEDQKIQEQSDLRDKNEKSALEKAMENNR